MKNLITSVASIIIFMMFISQFAANQVTYLKIVELEQIAQSLQCESVSEEDLISEIKDTLNEKGFENSYYVKKTDSGYEIHTTISNVIGPSKIIGLPDKENRIEHITYLMPIYSE